MDLAPYILECNETLPDSRRQEVFQKVKDYYLGSDGHFSQNTFDKFTEVIYKYYYVNESPGLSIILVIFYVVDLSCFVQVY